jgi:hypothetical protein
VNVTVAVGSGARFNFTALQQQPAALCGVLARLACAIVMAANESSYTYYTELLSPPLPIVSTSVASGSSAGAPVVDASASCAGASGGGTLTSGSVWIVSCPYAGAVDTPDGSLAGAIVLLDSPLDSGDNAARRMRLLSNAAQGLLVDDLQLRASMSRAATSDDRAGESAAALAALTTAGGGGVENALSALAGLLSVAPASLLTSATAGVQLAHTEAPPTTPLPPAGASSPGGLTSGVVAGISASVGAAVVVAAAVVLRSRRRRATVATPHGKDLDGAIAPRVPISGPPADMDAAAAVPQVQHVHPALAVGGHGGSDNCSGVGDCSGSGDGGDASVDGGEIEARGGDDDGGTAGGNTSVDGGTRIAVSGSHTPVIDDSAADIGDGDAIGIEGGYNGAGHGGVGSDRSDGDGGGGTQL